MCLNILTETLSSFHALDKENTVVYAHWQRMKVTMITGNCYFAAEVKFSSHLNWDGKVVTVVTPVNPLPLAAVGSSYFHWKKAESIETDMKIILSPN